MCTVGTESVQTPLRCSLFVSLQPFAKIKNVHVKFQFFVFNKCAKISTFLFFSVKMGC